MNIKYFEKKNLLYATIITITSLNISLAIASDNQIIETISQTFQDLGKNYTKDNVANVIYYKNVPIKVYSPNTFTVLDVDDKKNSDYDAKDRYFYYQNGKVTWNDYDSRDVQVGPSNKTLFDSSYGIPIDCYDVYKKPAELFKCYQTYIHPEQWAKIPALNPDQFTIEYIRGSTRKWFVRDDKYLIEFKKDKELPPLISLYLGERRSPKYYWNAIYYSRDNKIFYETKERNDVDRHMPFEVIDADIGSFEILEVPAYSKDQNNIYFYDKKLNDLIQATQKIENTASDILQKQQKPRFHGVLNIT